MVSKRMFTILWDNDGVLVNTEGLYFQACQTFLKTVGIDLTVERFKEIYLHHTPTASNGLIGHQVFQTAGLVREQGEDSQGFVSKGRRNGFRRMGRGLA